jgi:glucosamine-6-phosphate deaminase
MRILVVVDSAEFAHRGAGLIVQAAGVAGARIGLPTGATPVPVYDEIERRAAAGEPALAGAALCAIDEFAGVPSGTPGTNTAFFQEHLPAYAVRVPDSAAADPDAHVRDFATAIHEAGGLDLCVLGIGTNGHIAFNEPGSSRASRARTVALDLSTREAHAGAFGSLDAVPARGMTLGVADLLEARALVMLATGDAKADVVRQAIEGDRTAKVPASWLQNHANVTWLLDRSAASALH